MLEIVPRSSFAVWFKRSAKRDYIEWEVYTNTMDHKLIGRMEDDAIIHLDISEIYTDELVLREFDAFKNRPEYSVGEGVSIIDLTHSFELANMYNNLLTGAMLIEADTDDVLPKIERCLNWLNTTDFYVAPGSTIYHDAEPQGLIKHTLRVYNKLLELMMLPTFSQVKLYEAVIVALTHDWCKLNVYEQYKKNVKDEITGQWEQVDAYKYRGPQLPMGHGTTSMFMVMKFMKLTTEQALALNWHMGHWRCNDDDVNDLQCANETYPLVHLLQFADQLSIVKY